MIVFPLWALVIIAIILFLLVERIIVLSRHCRDLREIIAKLEGEEGKIGKGESETGDAEGRG